MIGGIFYVGNRNKGAGFYAAGSEGPDAYAGRGQREKAGFIFLLKLNSLLKVANTITS